MKRIKELYELFEKNVNIPKREETLNAISSHSKRDELARLVFERADGNVFAFAKNQLLPANDADEYGPFDHLLEAGHCMRILKMMAKEDYVINLLKDDFRAEHGREPNSLSDIARIFAEREYITKESSLAKRRAVFQTDGTAKIGSTWIITLLGIEGVDDDDDRWQESVYVYKILRKEGISLEKVNFHRSSLDINIWYFDETFLFEPFLIMLNSEENTYYVLNLLEPSEPPRAIRMGGRPWFMLQKDDIGQYRYDSDVRLNGELREAVLFPLIYVQDDNSFCIECAQISSSSIEILWKETIIVPEMCFEKRLYLLDNDNLILHIILEVNEDHGTANGLLAFHIILSRRKIIRYDFPQISGDAENKDADDSDGDDSDGDDSDEDNDKNENGDPGFTTFCWLSEEKDFEIKTLCSVRKAFLTRMFNKEGEERNLRERSVKNRMRYLSTKKRSILHRNIHLGSFTAQKLPRFSSDRRILIFL
ncbi:Oidioi.mRNA.OKI2018_I69.chr2.g5888.t1.cds [Oikopleura dioica]|uniref:Oidioi.mRNA.OKI2018_I69.chr2.g5888.t1.cds n=1 Tax=Oikopleura dioica TaxID=34765 RepID=A0ABN7T4X5_OIKDI|nr:Oidioi.mRNA.OKI2018_I69.chr2.g5888.t1.cds [Oikopleura dioica]